VQAVNAGMPEFRPVTSMDRPPRFRANCQSTRSTMGA